MHYLASHLDAFQNGRLVAWDQARLINLVRAGRTMGWLDDATASGRILPAARRIQAEYRSWHQMSDNYLSARAYWGGSNDTQDEYAQAAARLLADPASPWRTLAWDTLLG